MTVDLPVSKGAHMDSLLVRLAAERAILATESERLAAIVLAGRRGRVLRVISLAYGTGCKDDFELERRCRASEVEMELVRSRARVVDREYRREVAASRGR